MIKIFKLIPNPKNPDPFVGEWDVPIAFVISDKSGRSARKKAAYMSGDMMWKNPEKITCITIGESYIDPQIILADFKRG